MRHTRTLVRAEKLRPRATGQRWHELTSKFDASRIDPHIAAADMQWRQRLIANQQTDDMTTIQPHLTEVLAQPGHPLHTLAHTFINTFNAHYQPLLTLSSKQSSQLLYFATTELDHFSACLANVCSVMWPELYSRDFHGTCRSAVFEYVCPAVYVVLFAIYKRVNYYRDASFSAKCTSLQQIDIALLGVEPALQLKPKVLDDTAPVGTPTKASGGGGGAAAEGGGDGADSARVAADGHLSPNSVSGGGGGVQRQLSMLAPPVINTSSSPPTTPTPATPSPQPSLSQPHTPVTSSPRPSPSSSARRTRKAVTRLKTLTSFDRDMLKESERALAIADVLNQTSEEIEGVERPDDDEAEAGEGEEGHETDAGQTEGNGQTEPGVQASDGVEAGREHEKAAPVSSLSAALKQLKTEAELAPDKVDSPLPYSPSTLISPVQSTRTSPSQSSITAPASTITSSPSQLSLPPSVSASSLNTPSVLAPHYPYHEAVLLFRRLTAARTPRAKLSIFHSLSKQICLCVDDYYRALSSPSLSISADDLLSILSYIIIKARLPYMWSEVSFIQDFVSEGERMSQLGYFLAVFQASVEMISNLGLDKPADELKDGQEGAGVEEDEKARKAGVSGADDGEGGRESVGASTSLPSPSPDMATSPASSLSSQPHVQPSSAMLTPSASASSLSSSSSTLSAATASSSSTGEGEESSAVLHMDMSSLLNDTSLVNNYHFAVPPPDDRDEPAASSGRKAPSGASGSEMKEVAGGGMGSGSPKVVGRTVPMPVPVVEEKKKKRGWLSRRKD